MSDTSNAMQLSATAEHIAALERELVAAKEQQKEWERKYQTILEFELPRAETERDSLRAENEKLKAGLESHALEILADCEKHNADLLSDNNLLQANNQQLRASLAELREIATAMRSMIEDIQAPYMVSTSKPVAAFDEWEERNP